TRGAPSSSLNTISRSLKLRTGLLTSGLRAEIAEATWWAQALPRRLPSSPTLIRESIWLRSSMGMERPVPMDTNKQLRRVLGGLLLAATTSLPAQVSSSKTVRHHRVIEQDPSQPPELSQPEAAIEKKDYSSAEPLLKKVVAAQPSNYQAWFDLGFVYNALGKSDECIAAYRQSVTAKPDIFESNLNLGLSLAKSNQPGAEEFLRAATKLKPQSHPDEGHARAWLGLGHMLEERDPDAAIEAFRQAAALQPKDPEPRLSAGFLYEKANNFADAEEQFKQALTLDPSSQDALVGLANVYMRGKRYP